MCPPPSSGGVSTQRSAHSVEHHLGDVRLVLNLARRHVFVVVQVVLLPALADVKPFLVQVHEVEEVLELVSSAQLGGCC